MGTHESYQKLATQLDNSIQRHDYQEIVNITDLLFQNHWFNFIDARAHAEAMLGNLDQSLHYVQQIIDFSSSLATAGYIRKAKTYSLYGYQQKAIDVYDKGLSCINSTSTTANDRQKQQKIDQLTTGKKEAIILQKNRMDFIGKVLPPVEIVDYIISLLPASTLISCLAVSKLWRKRVLECNIAWKDVVVEDDNNNNYGSSQLLIGAIHHIAPYITNFTLNTINIQVLIKCFAYIETGYIPKIQSLELTNRATQSLQPNNIISLLSSLRTRHELTTLKISLVNNQRDLITLLDILTCWPTIQTVVFSTTSVLQPTIHPDPLRIPLNHSLIDLEIRASSIMGHSFEPILQRCLKLRRLVLHGMHSRVFNTVFRNTTPNLEIFVLNPRTHPSIPTLQDIQTRRPATGSPRLQILQVSGFHHEIPSYAALPLIHKHRETLETIYGNISSMAPMASTLASYGDFRLSSIKKLVIWIVDHMTQDFWCRLIRRSTTLHYLEVNTVYNINSLVTTLMSVSPVRNLGISNVQHGIPATTQSSLISLFERYAQVSNSANVKSTSSLEMITLRYCNGLNDDLLTSLKNVSTLHGIWFGGLKILSSAGIKQFIINISNRLTYVQFEDMIQVKDTILTALGDMKKLTTVKLQRLQNITDQGVRKLVETKNNKNSTCLLMELVIKRCPLISNQSIQFVKEKVKVVEYSIN
ncbi:hypothetical protein INT45_013784 [Circinella minor]|uniref:F-box domain-containing protein n=1 Tax=Circinella minor TaxID=1195481 RepID=A0A8H7VDF3_9FUNG|nr:hypothetical protein INT45_013784 [Circinella minor]